MITLTMRPYAGETDLQPIADLLNACEVVDRLDNTTSVADLRLEFNDPEVDQARDLRLWQDDNGKLIGFGQTWIPKTGEDDGYLWFRVHPEARDRGLETEIVAWGEARMRELQQRGESAVKLRSGAREDQSDRIALLERCGFTVERHFLTMERSLEESIPSPQFPVGFTPSHARAKLDAEAWVEMFNQSFIDHWNYHPLTIETHRHWLTDPDYRPELDLVAIAPDGMFAAFCYCHIDREDNSRRGCNEGWVAILGTRRGFRRMGLGRAVLLTGMHQLRAAGMTTAKLGVDTQNPNNARHLYESVGFRKLHTRLSYVKDV